MAHRKCHHYLGVLLKFLTGILASSQEPAEVAVCGAAAEITRLCLQSDTEEVEVASFDPANDVKVPEMELCHSEKVDRAMETWAEREAGFISVSLTYCIIRNKQI